MDFRNLLDPFWGISLKTVLGIHDPRISWFLFGTQNHKIRGSPEGIPSGGLPGLPIPMPLWLFTSKCENAYYVASITNLEIEKFTYAAH